MLYKWVMPAFVCVLYETLMYFLAKGVCNIIVCSHMVKIQFRNKAHIDFVFENLEKCRHNDCYHQAFFYVMGISEETRMNIGKMFDFKNDCIVPEGMYGGWQTSGTVKVCHLAFNLWNGFTEEGKENLFTPDELFCCGYAPYFMEGIKLRYPEYCRDLTPPKRKDMER
ncbi:hypothetical protein EDD59_110103 [Muricomes intestini]|uniref:Uncharacterized protein n=2 Tax=Muricomes intestini TaxID=1796634 RepID=A0A4R3K7R0_9FIRM|nr:hypothetical protein EDD59_110103 [Muricomes intestini]